MCGTAVHGLIQTILSIPRRAAGLYHQPRRPTGVIGGGYADRDCLSGNSWVDDASVPTALANVATNDYADAGLEVCGSDDGS